jgi:multidrug efflux pump subunit AcrB
MPYGWARRHDNSLILMARETGLEPATSGVTGDELNQWASKMLAKLQSIKGLEDVSSDQQTGSSQLMIEINRAAAARLGVNVTTIEQTLYDAFGQPFVTQLYAPLNTYYVILEIAPKYRGTCPPCCASMCMAPPAR